MIEAIVIGSWLGILALCVGYGVVCLVRDALLGAAFRHHMGSYELAYKFLRCSDEHTDDLIKRGMRSLSVQEIDELLDRKPVPIGPREFRVVDRSGTPLRFEP